jgi:ribonucleoside-diphosphate reductase beta chain
MMLNWDNPLAAPVPHANGYKPHLKSVDEFFVDDEPVVEVDEGERSTETQVESPAESAASATTVTEAASGSTDGQAEAAVTAKTSRSVRKSFTQEPFKPQQPVRAEDKRVINGSGDINQLAPFKYPWAWEFFINANKNHWTPLDINMAQDVHDYHHNLKPEEIHVYENVLAYLTTSDILAMRNIGLAVMEKMTAPELQIYQARQVYEESLHTWTYQHCIETIGLDQSEIYNRYRVVPEINGKIQIANRRLNDALRADIDLKNPDDLHDFVLSYTYFAAIFEGCWFYNGFSPIFALQRRGLMKGTAEQLQYIMRDEVLHCSFGIRVVRQIMQEENVKLDPQAVRDMWDEAEAAEAAYAKFLLPNPILGYNAEDHSQQFRFIANRRARQLGLEEPFPGAQNALPWLDEQSNMRKEKNFFETRVTEYQTGGALKWD